MRLLPVVVVVFFIVFTFDVKAQTAKESSFTLSYFCSKELLRKLFKLSCVGVGTSVQKPDEKETRSLKLQFFQPPALEEQNTTTTTNSPKKETTDSTSNSPDSENSTEGQNAGDDNTGDDIPDEKSVTFPSASLSGKTQSVIWVYQGTGRCWNSWADASCLLIAHEDGADAVGRDLDNDGKPDITCSVGSGTRHATTLANVSTRTLTLNCERYHCTRCTSGDDTHTQCNGGIDPSSERLSHSFSIPPGCYGTCSPSGAVVSCGSPQSAPKDTASKPASQVPQLKPTPSLPPGKTPPVVSRCRIGSGPCSVENLMKYWNTYEGAYKASLLCQAESASNPMAANRGCLTGRSLDYSIGLFQINLVAHCSEAIVRVGNTNYCKITNQTKLNACIKKFHTASENIRFAVGLSRNGIRWYPTWSAAGPKYCNIKNG